MHHDLKSHPPLFQPVLDGAKQFEIRRNDRDFHVGDTVTLREYDPAIETQGMEAHYTGRHAGPFGIAYVTDFEQKPGFVVFGIKPAI